MTTAPFPSPSNPRPMPLRILSADELRLQTSVSMRNIRHGLSRHAKRVFNRSERLEKKLIAYPRLPAFRRPTRKRFRVPHALRETLFAAATKTAMFRGRYVQHHKGKGVKHGFPFHRLVVKGDQRYRLSTPHLDALLDSLAVAIVRKQSG